jgi:hypothetical protein
MEDTLKLAYDREEDDCVQNGLEKVSKRGHGTVVSSLF